MTGLCACVPLLGCTIPIPVVPGATSPGSAIPISPIPLPEPLQNALDKLGEDVSRTTEKLGNDTLTTIEKAGGDTVRTLQKASGDTFATIQKAGDDSIRTISKAADDATATYVKAWRDIGEQGKRSFNDATEAGQAVSHFVESQVTSQSKAFDSAARRIREGKVVDSMWGLATEPLQSGEENFAKATQESSVINAAAGAAAVIYGGPAGAAAYAAWSTYRRTGDADLAIRAGILAAMTSQMGSSVSGMPAGTTDEIIMKAAIAGAAGGVSVAAAGGDEQAIKEGFLKSSGSVLIQGGSDKLKAYAPKAKGAFDTVQCISARDVDCLSNTTWVRDAKGKILYDEDGKPRIDTNRLDPKQYVGKWTGLAPESIESKKNAFIAQISKLPDMEAIPILKNQWVLTWTLGRDQDIEYKMPTVVLTHVGKNPPFNSTVKYGTMADIFAAPDDNTGDGSGFADNVSLWKLNGSILSMSNQGDNIEIIYVEPTTFIKNTGVVSGDVKFRGKKAGLYYTGNAYIRTKNCHNAFEYKMSGSESNDHNTLILDGKSPRYVKGSCQIGDLNGKSGSHLEFSRARDLEAEGERIAASRKLPRQP
jgi:hypothetical protein